MWATINTSNTSFAHTLSWEKVYTSIICWSFKIFSWFLFCCVFFIVFFFFSTRQRFKNIKNILWANHCILTSYSMNKEEAFSWTSGNNFSILLQNKAAFIILYCIQIQGDNLLLGIFIFVSWRPKNVQKRLTKRG